MFAPELRLSERTRATRSVPVTVKQREISSISEQAHLGRAITLTARKGDDKKNLYVMTREYTKLSDVPEMRNVKVS